jgi:D-xylose transport system permease protein
MTRKQGYRDIMNSAVSMLWQSLNKRVLIMIGLMVFIWFVFNALSDGYILRPDNLANLFKQVAVVAVLATGMTLIIASGNIDLSVGSSLGMFGALTAAFIAHMGLNSYCAVALVLMLGFLVGAAHGALVYYLSIPSFIVTLGGLIAYRGVTQFLSRQTIPVKEEWIKGISQGYLSPGMSIAVMVLVLLVLIGGIYAKRRNRARAAIGNRPLWIDLCNFALTGSMVVAFSLIMILGAGFPVQTLIFLCLAVVVAWMARYTRFGHYLYAIGGNKQAALYSGVPAGKSIVLTFGLMGLISAIAGIITIAELNAAPPDIGDLKELEAIAACVIGGASLTGGVGNVGMSVLGALIMASIKNGMSMMGIVAQMQKVILGTLLVLAVALDQWSRRTKN